MSTIQAGGPVIWVPVSTVSALNAAVSPGGSAHEAVDESVASDTDYITLNAAGVTANVVMRLDGVSPSSRSGATLTVRAKGIASGTLTSVKLGGKTFATTSLTTSYQNYTYALNASDAAAWSLGDLRIEIQCVANFVQNYTTYVSFVSLTINP